MFSYTLAKKYVSVFLLAFLLPLISLAQISTDPSFPNLNQPLTIHFDATGTALEGVTGSLYAHTGVIISETDRTWRYVIGNWGQNNVQPQFENTGTDQWKLEIDDIRDFYSVPESEDIFEIALVIRNAAGNQQTEDLFIELFDEVVSVRFLEPEATRLNPFFASLNDEVQIRIAATTLDDNLSEIRLFVNDELVATEDDGEELSYTYVVDTDGRVDLRAEAEDVDGNKNEESIFIIVNPPISDKPRPDGIRDGINYIDDNTVILSMYAPTMDFVYTIGDFTDWEVNPDFFMHREDQGDGNTWWWIEVDGLTPGTEYRFQYLVNGRNRIGDLFSEKVLDPWNDRWINENFDVYPDLIPYPDGLTEGMVSVLETGQTPFPFSDFERPNPEHLVIYELLLRDFVEESTYTVLKDTLGYLERLGVNAIELMPVSNFDGNVSWGYNPNFHLALEKSYGTRRAFKEFVEAAHQRGMAVILDVVYNHGTDLSPFIAMFGSNQAENPFRGPSFRYSVFNHLNHDHFYVQYWLDRANRHWIERYNVDGYRFDLTKGFASNVDVIDVDSFNPQRVANLRRMADALWDFDPDAYIIIEHFQREEEIALSTHRRDEGRFGIMSWNAQDHQYQEASMGWTSNLSATYFPNAGFSVPTPVTFMESHDEQWMMFKNLNYGNSSGDYDITELSTALGRQKLAGAFFLTVPGPRMLWQFGELGYGGGPEECLKPGDGTDGECLPSDPGRTDRKPIRWDYYDDPERFAVYQTWSDLLKLRNQNEVFHSTDTQVSMNVTTSRKRIVLEHETMDAVIIGNFGVTEQEVLARFTEAGTWYDYFSGQAYNITGSGDDLNVNYSLPPGEFMIFTSEPVESPTSARGDDFADSGLPTEFSLDQNYPNPFNPTTVIQYNLPQNSEVTLEVFDMLGRRVAILMNGQMQTAGTQAVTFDAAHLSSGTYLLRMNAGNQVMTRKMMLIK